MLVSHSFLAPVSPNPLLFSERLNAHGLAVFRSSWLLFWIFSAFIAVVFASLARSEKSECWMRLRRRLRRQIRLPQRSFAGAFKFPRSATQAVPKTAVYLSGFLFKLFWRVPFCYFLGFFL